MNKILCLIALSLVVFNLSCAQQKTERRAACPASGEATAFAINTDGTLLYGPDAVGGSGDYALRSRNATFVISGPDREITYYHYGGIPVDAAPTKDCLQTAEDQFGEMAMMLIRPDFNKFFHSDLRAFRAEKVEIIHDGSDGKAAHVRATGVDDYYWLIEYVLITEAYRDGTPRPLSQPYGIRWIVDYTLEPDGAVLKINATVENLGHTDLAMVPAVTMIMGNLQTVRHYSDTTIEFGGESFFSGIPWMTAAGNGGSYGFAMPGALMTGGSLHGVNASFNLKHFFSPLNIPAGGSSETVEFLLSAATPDAHAAIAPLREYLQEPLPDTLFESHGLRGKVFDSLSGKPISDAIVLVEAQNEEGLWKELDAYQSATDGTFGPEGWYFDESIPRRLRVLTDDRNELEPVPVGTGSSTFNLALLPRGILHTTVIEVGAGQLPAKLTLYRQDRFWYRFFLSGDDTLSVAPGEYRYYIARGFEYEPVSGTVRVPETGAAEISAVLQHIVDTSGYLSADSHVHAAPSPDSQVPLTVRVRDAAAEGLEVPVATDHEAIVGLQSGIDETGLSDWVATVTGEEVTATRPEHMTAFPMQPDGSPRGGIVKWYGKGPAELNAAIYERGAEVVLLNHPRGGSGLLSLIGWDRRTAKPTLNDPTLLGWQKGTSLWTWNLQGWEYMNGTKTALEVPGDEENTGRFDDWMSFLNHSHHLVGVGASDSHGLTDLGMPRTYFASSSDDVRKFSQQEMIRAYQKGNLVVSAGAFARATVNGNATMGDMVTDTDGSVVLHLHIEAIPQIDVAEYRVFVNCDQILRGHTTDPDGVVKLDMSVPITVSTDAHIITMGFGQLALPRGFEDYDPMNRPRFTTNPIWVDADGDGVITPVGDKRCSYDPPDSPIP